MTKILANLDQEWIGIISRARSGLMVFSPYITPCTTVSSLAGRGAKVYTRFSLRDFASKASSLDALEELVETCQLFEIADLHAKIIMDGSSFVTVGSQNLTHNGARRNKEMNLRINASKLPVGYKKLRRIVDGWVASAAPIDRDRITAMRKRLEAAEEAYKAFESKISTLQTQVDRDFAGIELKKAEADRQAEFKRNRDAIGKVVREAKPLQSAINASVVESGEKTPFLIFKDQKLTSFNRAGESVPIERLMRYMCLLPSGQLRWARLASQQITRFGSFLRLGNVLEQFPGLQITISSSKRSLRHGPAATNIVILVRSEDNLLLCRIPIRFRLNTLKIFEAVPYRRNKEANQFLAWLVDSRPAFKKLMLTLIGQPNFADSRGKLYGLDAKQVFGPHGTGVTLQVMECNSHPLLVIRDGLK